MRARIFSSFTLAPLGSDLPSFKNPMHEGFSRIASIPQLWILRAFGALWKSLLKKYAHGGPSPAQLKGDPARWERRPGGEGGWVEAASAMLSENTREKREEPAQTREELPLALTYNPSHMRETNQNPSRMREVRQGQAQPRTRQTRGEPAKHERNCPRITRTPRVCEQTSVEPLAYANRLA